MERGRGGGSNFVELREGAAVCVYSFIIPHVGPCCSPQRQSRRCTADRWQGFGSWQGKHHCVRPGHQAGAAGEETLKMRGASSPHMRASFTK